MLKASLAKIKRSFGDKARDQSTSEYHRWPTVRIVVLYSTP